METIFAISTFAFGVLFIIAAIFFTVMAIKEHRIESRGLGSWGQTILIIGICLFAAYNTLISGYFKMLNAGFIS